MSLRYVMLISCHQNTYFCTNSVLFGGLYICARFLPNNMEYESSSARNIHVSDDIDSGASNRTVLRSQQPK